MNIDFYINNLWLWKCGLPENEPIKPVKNDKSLSFEVLSQTEWSSEFEQLMRNRLIMGGLRYGKIGQKNKKQYARVAAMIFKLARYNTTGNKELLVDVANLCLLEFVECDHPNQHFYATDDIDHVEFI